MYGGHPEFGDVAALRFSQLLMRYLEFRFLRIFPISDPMLAMHLLIKNSYHFDSEFAIF